MNDDYYDILSRDYDGGVDMKWKTAYPSRLQLFVRCVFAVLSVIMCVVVCYYLTLVFWRLSALHLFPTL